MTEISSPFCNFEANQTNYEKQIHLSAQNLISFSNNACW